jgi:hypothetical protein
VVFAMLFVVYFLDSFPLIRMAFYDRDYDVE